MRILFFMARPGHVRNYDSTLRLLAERGHTVHLAFSSSRPKRNEPPDLVQAETLSRECPAITFGDAPHRDLSDGWTGIAGQIRLWGDFARFLHPRYGEAPLLRKRATRRLERGTSSRRSGPVARLFGALVRALSRRDSRALSNAIGWFSRLAERAVPPSKTIEEYVQKQRPDVVLVTPAVEIGSAQAEYFKAAKALQVQSAVCVASWDNLTNKGVLRAEPEAVFVWNDVQRREAVELHRVPHDRVILTGAPRFDDWFARKPSRSSRRFKEAAGLDANRPYLLYLCSSPFIAPNEVGFVRAWIDALRASPHEVLATAGVLVRPHPQNAAQWCDVSLEAFGNAVIWPHAGAQVTDEETKADFFDSIAHSAAVVGVNTTALIEAAILGKCAFTVTTKQFSATQQGTLHYRYLREENGGFLQEAGSIEENLAHLRPALEGDRAAVERTRGFVRAFVRPFGLDVPATPLLAGSIEKLAETPLRSRGRLLSTLVFRAPLSAVAACSRLRARWKAWRRGKQPFPARTTQRIRRSGPVRQGDRWLSERLTDAPADAYRGPERRARRLFADSTGRIVVGPWTGDAASEALHFIPCLRWMLGYHERAPEQLTVMSRNGVGAWYDGLAGSVVEPAEADLRDCPVREMVETLIDGQVPLRLLIKRSRYARLPAPPDRKAVALTAGYVVVAIDAEASGHDATARNELLTHGLGVRAPTATVRSTSPCAQEWKLEGLPIGANEGMLDASGLSALVAGAQAVLGSPRSAGVALSVCHGVRTIAIGSHLDTSDWQRVEILTRVAHSLGSSFTLIDPGQIDSLIAAISPARQPGPARVLTPEVAVEARAGSGRTRGPDAP